MRLAEFPLLCRHEHLSSTPVNNTRYVVIGQKEELVPSEEVDQIISFNAYQFISAFEWANSPRVICRPETEELFAEFRNSIEYFEVLRQLSTTPVVFYWRVELIEEEAGVGGPRRAIRVRGSWTEELSRSELCFFTLQPLRSNSTRLNFANCDQPLCIQWTIFTLESRRLPRAWSQNRVN